MFEQQGKKSVVKEGPTVPNRVEGSLWGTYGASSQQLGGNLAKSRIVEREEESFLHRQSDGKQGGSSSCKDGRFVF